MKVKQLLPILNWLPTYKRAYLSGDLSAGLTVGVMLIPQGMAYAMIAGLPPVYGLYAALIPQVVYSIFGTSRQLAVGPVAMDSLLVAAGISTMAVLGTEEYIILAILLSFMMGVVQVAFGALRLGFLVNFLSKPVISGFTSAAALIIGLNQLKHILGIDIARNNNIFRIIYDAVLSFDAINWIAVFIGVIGIFIIKYVKKIHKSIPGALVAVIVGILAVQFGGLTKLDVIIVGEIPEGLPKFSLPDIGSEQFVELIPIALTLALIAFMESISVAKAIQSKHKGEYELDNNQEMIGLGMGNIVGSLFQSYPTTGGFSRSAVNDQSGANTNLAAIISAALIGLTLLFLTPLFYYLPKAILGSIIMVAVFGLIDLKFPKYLWETAKEDFSMFIITLVITLSFGIIQGIGAGVAISLFIMIYKSTKPHIAILGQLKDNNEYRNIKRFKELAIRNDILVIRHDAPLYFANISNFVDSVKREVKLKGTPLKLVVLHCASVSSIDTTALQTLGELIDELKSQKIQVSFSSLIGPIRDFMYTTEFINRTGENHFFIDVQSAIEYYDKGQQSQSIESYNIALQTNYTKEKN